MPTYTYQCNECEHVTTETKSIAQYKICPTCEKCGGSTRKVILKAPLGFVQGSIAYKCVATGETITNRNQRKEIMKRHDLVDAV